MSRASGPLQTGGLGSYPERPSRKRMAKMLRSEFAIGLDFFVGWIFFFVSCGGQGGGNASVPPLRTSQLFNTPFSSSKRIIRSTIILALSPARMAARAVSPRRAR